MITRDIGENFRVILSTKKSLFGAPASDFSLYYANVNDLSTKIALSGGMSEAIESIDSGSEHTATTTAAAPQGARKLLIDGANSTLEEGDVIEYASGRYAYIQRIVDEKVYLKTPLKSPVASGSTLTQVGNSAEYASEEISIPDPGEYLLTIEASRYGILAQMRIKVIDPSDGQSVDPDAPDETIAVAY